MKLKTWERCLELSGTKENGPDEYEAAAIQIYNCSEWDCHESQEWGSAVLTELSSGHRLCPQHLAQWLTEQDESSWILTRINNDPAELIDRISKKLDA